jgi:hypothetical protein
LCQLNLLIYASFSQHYVISFPSALIDAVEQYFKDNNITLEGMSLEMVDHHIKIVIQEHCLEKRVTKYFKRFDNMFTSYLFKDVGQMLE